MKRVKIISIILLAVAAAFVFVGIMQGDYADILNKAKYICYECIGMG